MIRKTSLLLAFLACLAGICQAEFGATHDGSPQLRGAITPEEDAMSRLLVSGGKRRQLQFEPDSQCTPSGGYLGEGTGDGPNCDVSEDYFDCRFNPDCSITDFNFLANKRNCLCFLFGKRYTYDIRLQFGPEQGETDAPLTTDLFELVRKSDIFFNRVISSSPWSQTYNGVDCQLLDNVITENSYTLVLDCTTYFTEVIENPRFNDPAPATAPPSPQQGTLSPTRFPTPAPFYIDFDPPSEQQVRNSLLTWDRQVYLDSFATDINAGSVAVTIDSTTPTISPRPTSTFRPSQSPTRSPAPSMSPSASPSGDISREPSARPSAQPSSIPSSSPSNTPDTSLTSAVNDPAATTLNGDVISTSSAAPVNSVVIVSNARFELNLPETKLKDIEGSDVESLQSLIETFFNNKLADFSTTFLSAEVEVENFMFDAASNEYTSVYTVLCTFSSYPDAPSEADISAYINALGDDVWASLESDVVGLGGAWAKTSALRGQV